MTSRDDRCRKPIRWPFTLLSLLTLLQILVSVLSYRRIGVPEARVDALKLGRVTAGATAEVGGLREGDVVRTVNGIPFESYDVAPRSKLVGPGEQASFVVHRDGSLLALRVRFVPLAEAALPTLVSSLIVGLVFWSSSTILLYRRSYRPDVRLLFCLAQVIAVAVHLPPLGYLNWIHVSQFPVLVSILAVSLTAPVLLHYHVTYPVPLGTRTQRRWGLAAAYGAVVLADVVYVAAALQWLVDPVVVAPLVVGWFVLELLVSVVAGCYMYLWRADADQRRRLRVVVASVTLAFIGSAFLYWLPAAMKGVSLAPEWAVRPLLLLPLLGYAIATVRHGLFSIDRLLNRALVYAVLSVAVFGLYLGPLLVVDRLLGSSPVVRTSVVASMALIVGLSFDWARSNVQRWVDRLFYGGWYDYPAVVGSVSDALTGSLTRRQLMSVLTEQVPNQMHLRSAQLSLDAEDGLPRSEVRLGVRRFPLRFRGEMRGLWTVGPRKDGDPLSAGDERILETLARQAEIALSNVLLVEALERRLEEIEASREQLARARRRLLRSREEERGRLARELHDGPIQALVGLKLEIGLLLDAVDEGPRATADELTRLRRDVQNLLADVRQVCVELRPPILDTLGLAAAIRALGDEWSAQTGTRVTYALPSDPVFRSLDEHVAVNLYRIVQEGLSNVARHAAASEVHVCLRAEQGGVFLEIKDDGCGFTVPDDFDRLVEDGHFGLAGVGERVDLIGGSWAISAKLGGGTALRVTWRKRSTRFPP